MLIGGRRLGLAGTAGGLVIEAQVRGLTGDAALSEQWQCFSLGARLLGRVETRADAAGSLSPLSPEGANH